MVDDLASTSIEDIHHNPVATIARWWMIWSRRRSKTSTAWPRWLQDVVANRKKHFPVATIARWWMIWHRRRSKTSTAWPRRLPDVGANRKKHFPVATIARWWMISRPWAVSSIEVDYDQPKRSWGNVATGNRGVRRISWSWVRWIDRVVGWEGCQVPVGPGCGYGWGSVAWESVASRSRRRR
jgi:hypothetical protein